LATSIDNFYGKPHTWKTACTTLNESESLLEQ